MEVACPTCSASFEIDDAEAALPGTPVCEDCRVKASRDSRVPVPKAPGVRPRAPSLSRDEGGLSTLSIPDALPQRTRSRRPPPPDDEGDPVSLRELEAVLSPGIAPPKWKDAAPKQAPKKEKLSFFQVDEPPPDEPPNDEIPVDSDGDIPVDPDAPTSGLLDLRQLAASAGAEEKKPKKSADIDIFNLSGGIFPSKSLEPIDLSLLAAPPPPSSRPNIAGSLAPVLDAQALSRSRSTPPPKSSTQSSAPPPAIAGAVAHAEPAPSHRTANAAIAAAQRSAWTSRAVAIAAIMVAGVVVFWKVGRENERAEGEATSASARAEAAPAQPSLSALPPAISEPVKTASQPALEAKSAAPESPKPPKDPDGKRGDPPADKPGAPRATAQAEAPPKATVAPAPPKETAVVAAPPAPAGGAEFDRSAAKNALARAASAAAGCKKPDDPSGAAKVQVTFSSSGRVTVAKVSGPPFQGTPTGSCIAAAFRGATIPPFDGAPVSVSKDVVLR